MKIPANRHNSVSRAKVDLDRQIIPTHDADQYSAMAVIRKKVWHGALGYTYFVENREVAGKKVFGLYGGKIEHTDPTKIAEDKDRTAAVALARELNEELGPLVQGKTTVEYKPRDLNPFASFYRKSEGRESKVVDIYSLSDDAALGVKKHKIVEFQKSQELQIAKLEELLKNETKEERINSLKKEIRELYDAKGNAPDKIRFVGRCWFLKPLFGNWIMWKWGLTWQFPFLFRREPRWDKFSAVAVYAILTDSQTLLSVSGK